MFNKLRNIIASTINGKDQFSKNALTTFKNFSGQDLGERKAKAYVAQLLQCKNTHEFDALSVESRDDIEERIAKLCDECVNNVNASPYYDFYQSVFCETDTDEFHVVFLITTVYFDEDSNNITFNQKVRVESTNSDDLRDGTIHNGYGYLLPSLEFQDSNDNRIANFDNFNLELLEKARSLDDDRYQLLTSEIEKHISSRDNASKSYFAASAVRLAQSYEFDRITKVLGHTPSLNIIEADYEFLFSGIIRL